MGKGKGSNAQRARGARDKVSKGQRAGGCIRLFFKLLSLTYGLALGDLGSPGSHGPALGALEALCQPQR